MKCQRLLRFSANFYETKIQQTVEIYTGPVFAPIFFNGRWVYAQTTIGTFPRLITVPTHFFKIVLVKLRATPSEPLATSPIGTTSTSTGTSPLSVPSTLSPGSGRQARSGDTYSTKSCETTLAWSVLAAGGSEKLLMGAFLVPNVAVDPQVGTFK